MQQHCFILQIPHEIKYVMHDLKSGLTNPKNDLTVQFLLVFKRQSNRYRYYCYEPTYLELTLN